MRRTHIFLLYLLLFSVSCSFNARDGLFLNDTLNNELRLFIDTTKIDGGNNYYQINIGRNSDGAKVSFWHSTSNLPGSIYWYMPMDPVFLGYYISLADTVEIYSTSKDVFDYINRSAIKAIFGDCSPDSEVPCCKIVPKRLLFQVTSDGIRRLQDSSPLFHASYYHLSSEYFDDSNKKLVILDYPQEYQMFLGDVIVSGTWSLQEERMFFIPVRVLYYSPISDDVIDITEDYTNIKYGVSRVILSTPGYKRQEDGILIPLNYSDEEGFFWIVD